MLVFGCADKQVLKPQETAGSIPQPEPKVRPTPQESAFSVLMREAENYTLDHRFQDALLVYNQALKGVARGGDTADEDRRRVLSEVERVLSQMPPDDIKSFSLIKNLSIPQDLFMYWLGMRYMALGDDVNAKNALTSFLERFPGHDLEARIREPLEIIVSRTLKTDTLGCILPLTGKYKTYGLKALKGIQLAVEDFSRAQGRTLNVVVKDSQTDPERSVACVEELERENVFAIAGPLLMPEAAGQKANELGIPMVALTQKTEFPAMGEYLFTNFITPEMQVETLGDYVFGTLGLEKVAILYPRDRYGRKYMSLFWDVVDKYGGDVVGVASYDSHKTDFTEPIQKLTGEYYPIPDALKASDAEGVILSEEKFKGRSSVVANEDRIKIDFQALFIPDGLSRVNLILPQLAFHDARGMMLLGTNLWHRNSLIKENRRYNKNAVICDGYFGKSKNPVTQKFDRDFKRVFGEEPGFLEAIAYDTAGLLFTAVSYPEAGTRKGLKTLLQGRLMFEGVTGRTVFDEIGVPHKELFLMTVKQGAFKEILR